MLRTVGGRVARTGRGRGARYRAPCGAELLESRRLLSAGDLDTTFGGDGAVNTDFPGSAGDRGRQIAVQGDGKVLEVAWHQGFTSVEPVLSVTRFNTNGTLDTSFGVNGLAIVDVPDRGEWLASIAVAPGGKIYVGTWSTNPPPDLSADADFLVARLNPNGSLDTTFDGDGIRLIDLGTAVGGPSAAKTGDLLFDLAVQSDGKVIAAGYSSAGTQTTFALVRLNLDGSLDTSFDGDGVVNAPLGANNVFVGTVSAAIDTAGRIVVAGAAGTSRTNTEFAVARYNPNGSFDTTFDGDGWTLTPFSTSNDAANQVAIAPGGKIVAAGYAPSAVGSPNDMAVVRYNADGSLDTTFSGDGKALVGFSTGASQNTEEAAGLAVQPDGSVLITGRSLMNVAPRTPRSILVRLTPSGNLDGSFGAGGVADSQLSEPLSIGLLPVGGLIVVGGIATRPASFEDFAVERFDPAGFTDTNYGTGGLASADFPGSGFDLGRAGAVQADGKIIAAGAHVPNSVDPRDLAFARYNADGSLDNTFGVGGRVVIDLPSATGLSYAGEELQAIALDSAGRVVFAGSVTDPANGGAQDMFVGRLKTDGSLDTSFGSGSGVTVLSGLFPGGSANEEARDLVILPDGSIVLAGKYSAAAGASEFAAARVDSSGNVDTSFGDSGAFHTAVNGTDSEANAVTLIPDQGGVGFDLILAGRARNASSRDEFALVRLNANGSLDVAFDGDGKLTTSLGNGNAAALDVIVDSAGRVVAAGYALNPGTFSTLKQDFALARYSGAGALDPTFDGDGKVTTDFKKGTDRANSVLALPDGTYLAGGTSEGAPDTGNTQQDYALVRYGADGALVTSFGVGGKVTTNIDPTPFGNAALVGPDEIFDLLPYPGDRVVAVGATYASKTGRDFSAARYFLSAPATTRISRRDVFYNRSAFDGNNPGIDAADINAVATDKQALLPGQTATFANYTSFSRGINGIMVTLSGSVALTAGDFLFKTGDGAGPWSPVAAAPSGFEVRPLSGAPGTLATFTFPDGAIRNTWLQVTVLANAHTGLAAPDVFYFGNLVGETGNAPTPVVNVVDVERTRGAQSTLAVPITSRFDFDRDGKVTALDTFLARANQRRGIARLSAPAVVAVAAAPVAGVSPVAPVAPRRRGVWEDLAG